MKIIEKTVYTFAELTDNAKQKAEHWYCANVPYFWGEEHIAEVKAFLIALSHLPGAAELTANLPKSGDTP